MHRCLFAGLILLATSSVAAADDLFDAPPNRAFQIAAIEPLKDLYEPRILQPGGLPEAQPEKPKEPGTEAPPPEAPKAFGDKGTQFATYGAGLAYYVASADYNLRIAWSYFVIKNVEFSAELNGWFFDQPGDHAWGINPAFVFRWHFYNEERWSIYGDAGIGVMFSTEDVPAGGTDFNFTPRIGGGFTYRLDDEGTRLQVGLRWYHISNARITGDFENPARDGVMLYAGIMIPF